MSRRRRVVALTFDTSHEAHEALQRVLDLQRDKVIVVHDAVVVTRSEDGELELDEHADVTAIAVSVPAILFGAVFGTLLAGPLGFLAGALSAGALGVAAAKWLNEGISDRMLVDLERQARPGQSILAVQVGTNDAVEVSKKIPRRALVVGSVLLVVATASFARADDDPSVPVVMPQDDRPWYHPERIGFALTAGGGVAGFIGDTMRATTDDGGNWDVRAMVGTRLPIALEASYLGSAQSIDALGLDSSAVLLGNGLQANVRLNATTELAIQPFLYAGIAWRRYSLENIDFNTSDVADGDDVFELPLGVGVAYKFGRLVLDMRAEFRGAFDEHLVPDRTSRRDPDDAATLDRWGLTANIGYEF